MARKKTYGWGGDRKSAKYKKKSEPVVNQPIQRDTHEESEITNKDTRETTTGSGTQNACQQANTQADDDFERGNDVRCQSADFQQDRTDNREFFIERDLEGIRKNNLKHKAAELRQRKGQKQPEEKQESKNQVETLDNQNQDETILKKMWNGIWV